MFTHHIITCMLIATSYGHYMTRIGTVMLCIMDVVDFIFPVRLAQLSSDILCLFAHHADLSRLPNCSNTLGTRLHATSLLLSSS